MWEGATSIMTRYCIDCGCSEDEGINQNCIKNRAQHNYRSTEERFNPNRKHKERAL